MNFKQNEGTYECKLMQFAHLAFHKKLIPSFYAFLLGLCIGIHALQNLLLNAPIGKISSVLAFIIISPCTWRTGLKHGTDQETD